MRDLRGDFEREGNDQLREPSRGVWRGAGFSRLSSFFGSFG